jgi:hypothetical protein
LISGRREKDHHKVLSNIILGQIKPYIEKVRGTIRIDLEMEDL